MNSQTQMENLINQITVNFIIITL